MDHKNQGCHWTFAKITENLRVRAVSQKMNTKRDGKFRKRQMKSEKIENINIHFRQTEQLGKKTENGKRIGGEQIGLKITEKQENDRKSASL